MPFFLLIALFVAFGFDSTSPLEPLHRSALGAEAAKVLGGMAAIATLAFLLGRWVVAGVARGRRPVATLRRRYVWGARVVEVLTLVVYGWIIHQAGWPRVVHSGLGLGGMIVVDDALILLPYIVMQLAVWSGTYPAERALRSAVAARRPGGLGRHLSLRARQTLGLVLPMLLVYALGQDVVRRQWPGWASGTWSQPVEVSVMAATIMALSPIFVRIAWPTRPLPPGPLRDRLEHLSRRLGFRCSDILVWDTGQAVVNACVTGTLPRFRYVFLSDALIEYLDEHEIAAVFGHEIGHIAHRHLLYFGFFFAGSLGVLANFNESFDAGLRAVSAAVAGRDRPFLSTVIEAGTALLAVGSYFLAVFGHLSRRFERQADVFGCRSVSCNQVDCPPHADLDRLPGRGSTATAPCPVGIRIFANALANVAALNGMEPRARSWRHGSIARRIAFLEGLEGRPEAVRRFQRGVTWLRFAVALGMAAVVVVAIAKGAIGSPR